MTIHTPTASPSYAHAPEPGVHTSPELPALMGRIAQQAELMRSSGAANEAAGELIPAVVEALHATGVFQSAIPTSLGGYELSPRQLVTMMEEVSSLDASTGWVVLATNVAMAATAAYSDDETADEYFGPDRYTIMAGQGTRLGPARRVDGGYRVSGSWQFNSGAPLASVIHTGIIGDDGRALVATLPIEQVTTADNWDVMGLRATGSHDYTIDDVFVSDAHVYEAPTRTRKRGGAFYAIGLGDLAAVHHAGWALGVTKRLLEEMRELARTKSQRPGDPTATSEFWAAYADAEVRYRSARAFVLQTWSDVEDALNEGDALSTEQESLIRLATHNAKWTAHAVAEIVYKWAGTAALRPGDIQRFFRDVHAGVQHVSCGPAVRQGAGKQLAGLTTSDDFWMFFQLVEPAKSSV